MSHDPTDQPVSAADGLTRLLARPIGIEGLAENTAALSLKRQHSLREEGTILLFRIGGERFALPAASVLNVFPVAAVRKVPHRTRPPFRGLCCHEGAILLTGMLHVVLDMPADETGDAKLRRMIVIGSEESAWAFEVDAVECIRRVDPAQFRHAPATIPRNATSCTTALIPMEDGDAALLDPDAIRSTMERSIQ
ncbi:MAG: chemotaxis protein CheW [Planctomycetes bacterium]|nr:chemotaxis protein CheW [Planctomycetota bacterium]